MRFSHRHSGAFALVELLMVLVILSLLITAMLPAIGQARESARRVACLSQLYQIGIGIETFKQASSGDLPASAFAGTRFGAYASDPQFEKMMTAFDPARNRVRFDEVFTKWDGVSKVAKRGYLKDPKVFYCPASIHRFDENDWDAPSAQTLVSYHYRGVVPADVKDEWAPIDRARVAWLRTSQGEPLALLTDGLRSKPDFSHRVGANVLRVDLSSPRWFDDPNERIYRALPNQPTDKTVGDIWGMFDPQSRQ